MTIPITPGPFSFLAELGRAGGAAFHEAEQERQRKLDESYKGLNMLLQISKMTDDPTILGSEHAKRFLSNVGLPDISSQPTYEQTLNSIRKRGVAPTFAGDTIPAVAGLVGQTNIQPTGEAIPLHQRIAAGLPLPTDIIRQQNAPIVGRAEAAKAQAEIPRAQVSELQAQTELPEIVSTTKAVQQNTQDKQFNDIADAAVAQAYNAGGRKNLPSVEEAMAAGASSRRAQAFGNRIDRSYYDDAINRLRAKLKAEEIGMTRAQAPYAYGGSQDDARWGRIYQDQVDAFNNELGRLAGTLGITKSDAMAYSLWQSNKNMGKQTDPITLQRAVKYGQYLRQSAEIRARKDDAQAKLNKVSEKHLDMPGAGGEQLPTERSSDAEIQNIVEFMIKNNVDENTLNDPSTRPPNIHPQDVPIIKEFLKRRRGAPR